MKQEEDGKMFVGGVSWATTAEKMQQYFSKFGEVIESSIMKDKSTGQSRGFGFVKFKDPASVLMVLKAPRPHVLDSKHIDPKPCTPRDIQIQKKEAEMEHIVKYKIFIGGLTQNMTIDEVKNYFEKFGPTTEVVFALHKGSELNKGFGFVTYEKESSATVAVEQHFHDIGGKRVEAKRAQPREKMRSVSQTVKKSAGDNLMQDPSMYYGTNASFGGPPMSWYMGMGPPGGYNMPVDSGYGTYSTGSSGYGYSYGSGYTASSAPNYSDMGKYSQPSSYSNSKAPSRTSGNDSRSFHPYKR